MSQEDPESRGRSRRRNGTGRRRQGVYWILTIPHHVFTPYPMPQVSWCRGQLEKGETGYLHWQVCLATKSKQSVHGLKRMFGEEAHCELTRSCAAEEYVWKEETAVAGTRFEFGAKPFDRSSRTDWEAIWELAKANKIESIEASVRVCNYRTIRSIAADYSVPTGILRSCRVYWGPTGTGKSKRAWEEAGMGAYPKDPLSKFWCGYTNHRHVVIDEFRGGIQISHLLRWLDRYPINVEIKGSSVPLCAEKFWVTSNLRPQSWYPDLDEATLEALMRRLEIIEMQ